MACILGAFRSPGWPLIVRQGLRSYAAGNQSDLFTFIVDFMSQQKAVHYELISRMAMLERAVHAQNIRSEHLQVGDASSNLGNGDAGVQQEEKAVQMAREATQVGQSHKGTIGATGAAVAVGGHGAAGRPLPYHGTITPPYRDGCEPHSLSQANSSALALGDKFQNQVVHDIFQVTGSDVLLHLRLIGPRWQRLQTGRMKLFQEGYLLLEFSSLTTKKSGNTQGCIQFGLSPAKCAQLLLMDPEVGLWPGYGRMSAARLASASKKNCNPDPVETWVCLERNKSIEQGLETKMLRWSPSGEVPGMHLLAVQCNTYLGTTKNLTLFLPRSQVQLLLAVAERSI
eukprot:EG_transcript_18782